MMTQRTSPYLRAAALGTALLIVLLMCLLKSAQAHRFWYAALMNCYSLLACSFVVSRIILSMLYRTPRDNGHTPTVTMVVAAKNEEACIVRTLEDCLRARYPEDRLEVIFVDDGSDDGTWEAARSLKDRHPARLKYIRFERNLGKRHAMAAGVRAARGEIVIFVDSDSFPHPEGVYRLVQPLADPSVGAVSGHIVVDVQSASVISKMESVRYYIGHRFIKAAESLFGAVTCCPGPFSAYRRDAVLEVLDAWLNQTFLGVPATFGDDRALTLRILRKYRVVFHDKAICETRVPDRWRTFFRQQLRWKKSWMRELPNASRLMWKEHPVAAVSYFAGVAVTLLSPFIVLYTALYLPISQHGSPLFYLSGFAMSYLCLSLVCYYQTGTRYWYYGMLFGAVYIGILIWQNYYAMFTIKRNAWGTR